MSNQLPSLNYKIKNMTIENNEVMCCVCLMIPQQQEDEKNTNCMMKTKCNHVMCMECVDTIVSYSHSNQPSISSWNDILAFHPTQAKCPYCRAGFSIFDIQPLNPNTSCHFQKSEIPSMLSGSAYAVNKKLGYQSIHFPPLSGKKSNTLPYVRMDHPEAMDILQLSSFKNQPRKIHFEPGYSYHRKSNTFYGILKLNNVSSMKSLLHITYPLC